jgi:hypothetical protein
MAYRVTVRLNTRTGEFELFQVDALDTNQSPAQHNADHEEATTRLGQLVERRPAVEEVPGTSFSPPAIPLYQPAAEQEAQRSRDTQQEGA